MTDEGIAGRLRTFRAAKRLSQSAFAQEIGVTQSYITAVERGKKALSREMLVRVGDSFGVSLDWLISGRGPAPVYAQGGDETGKSDNLSKVVTDTILPAPGVREGMPGGVGGLAEVLGKITPTELELLQQWMREEDGEASSRDVMAVVRFMRSCLPALQERQIPVLGEVAAGVALEMMPVEDESELLRLTEEWSAHLYVRVDEAAQGSGLRAGDIAIVERGEEFKDGALGVVRYKGRVLVRWLFAAPNDMVLLARFQQSRYETFKTLGRRGDPEFQVLGSLVGMVRRLK